MHGSDVAITDRLPGTGLVPEAPVVLDAADGRVLTVPEGFPLAAADYAPAGHDLVITAPDGREVVVRDFFAAEAPPHLMSESGTVIAGDLAARLAGPRAPGQYAQAGPAPSAQPIGTVETAEKAVTAVRADGTEMALQPGDPVFQGDVLVTGDGAAVGIVLADETVLSLGADGRLVLDEMIYDPGDRDGEMGLSLLKGAFTFVSGQIAKTSADAMTVDTPAGTIGIRGTAGGIDVDDDARVTAALFAEEGGLVGEMVFTNGAGSTVINIANEALSVDGFDQIPSDPFTVSVDDVARTFGRAIVALPARAAISQDLRRGVEERVRAEQGEPEPEAPGETPPDGPPEPGQGEGGPDQPPEPERGPPGPPDPLTIPVTEGDFFGLGQPPPDTFLIGFPPPPPPPSDRPINTARPPEGPPENRPPPPEPPDTLTGTTGTDTFVGGRGDSTFVFSDLGGNDRIDDQGGTDVIRFENLEDVAIRLAEGSVGRVTFEADLGAATSGTVTFSDVDSFTAETTIDMSRQVENVQGSSGTGGNLVLTESYGIGDITGSSKAYLVAGRTTLADDIDLSGGTGEGALVFGLGGADTLKGLGSGNNVVDGGAGNDSVNGGDDSDTLIGGSGNDSLYGGRGDDRLIGGTGADRFHFDAGDTGETAGTRARVDDMGTDTIADFVTGVDKIVLDNADFGFGATTLSSTTSNAGFQVTSLGIGSTGADFSADGSDGQAIIIVGSNTETGVDVWFTEDQSDASTANSYQVARIENVTTSGITAGDFEVDGPPQVS